MQSLHLLSLKITQAGCCHKGRSGHLLVLGLPNNPARSFVLIREAPPDCHHICAVCATTVHQTLCPGNLHVLGTHRDNHHVLPFSSQPKKGNQGMNQPRNHHGDSPAWGALHSWGVPTPSTQGKNPSWATHNRISNTGQIHSKGCGRSTSSTQYHPHW